MPLHPRINKYALVTDLNGAKEKFARKITGNTRNHLFASARERLIAATNSLRLLIA